MKIYALVLLAGAILCLNASPGWAQTSSSAPAPRIGSSMPIYLYPDYHGSLGSASASETSATLYYQSDGTVYDGDNKLIGRLIDSAGHNLALTNGNGSYRVRTLGGTVIGTTDTPSTTSGVRILTLQPMGGGWRPSNPVVASTTGPVTTDQGGTTTGSAISASIRSGVGGGLSQSDQNTTTGTSSVPNPNDKGGPSGPIVGAYGAYVPAPNTVAPATNAPSSSSSH